MSKRNWLLGLPLQFGDPDQIRMISQFQYEHLTTGFGEIDRYHCIRCKKLNYLRIHQAINDRGFLVWKVVTPRTYSCKDCRGAAMVVRPSWQYLNDTELIYNGISEGEPILIYVPKFTDADPLKFINRNHDPLPYYNQIK